MKNQFKTLDDGIMYLTTKGVYAYNWTTGGTKAELANTLLGVAPVFASLCILKDYVLGAAPVVFEIGLVHLVQKMNVEQQDFETKAADKQMKDEYVENIKELYTLMGYLFVFGSFLEGYAANILIGKDQIGFVGLAGLSTSSLMIGAGCFVMRTEYLPPRKNALSRAKDKLVEIVKSYQWKPAVVPIN